jgi:hypothetical protein
LARLVEWHRINAEYAGADWVWEARLRTVEDLERRAAEMRTQLPDEREVAANEREEIHEERASGLVPPRQQVSAAAVSPKPDRPTSIGAITGTAPHEPIFDARSKVIRTG